ncbi:MAG: undecaprenyl-diphosphate phosphatase [Cyclobacteriaceae bacterium]|nr:undecaprenyl-diphosphate phosphatase [Cyclobacteriaceae bacterium]
MSIFQAIVLGIIQGLTEFLPVSSSGHVEIGSVLFGIQSAENLLFLTIIHGATSLSTIVVYRNDIIRIFRDLLKFQNNESLNFTLKILLSTIPVFILGMFFKEQVEYFFGGKTAIIGAMLIITGLLLTFAHYKGNTSGSVSYPKAFLIGIAQAIAVIPGISRSGATISTSLLLGVERERATRFSFLMVLIPIIGAMLLNIIEMIDQPELSSGISGSVLVAGFIAAFITGVIACTWMIRIVKKGKLIYFAIYCFILGLSAIVITFLHAGSS